MSYFNQIELVDQFNFLAAFLPAGEMTTVEPVRTAGSPFAGVVVDPNFWTTTVTGSGTVTQSGPQIVATGATANSTAIVQSKYPGRFIGESLNRVTNILTFGDTGTVNNTRRWGAFNGTDGVYFKLQGTTLYTATMINSVETAVPFASWTQTTTFPTLTNVNIYRIFYGSSRAWFTINNIFVNVMGSPAGSFSARLSLPVWMDNVNSGGLATNLTMTSRANILQRLGRPETQPIMGHVTTAGTQILKYGPGTLQRITFGNSGGSTFIVYDNTAGSGTIITSISPPAQAQPVTLSFGLPFYTGLTVVSTGTWDATIIYE